MPSLQKQKPRLIPEKLERLLTHDNPLRAEHNRLVRKQKEFRSYYQDPHPFAHKWSRLLEDKPKNQAAREYFRKRLEGGLLLDLGCGWFGSPYPYGLPEGEQKDFILQNLARSLDAKGYIGVDVMLHVGNIFAMAEMMANGTFNMDRCYGPHLEDMEEAAHHPQLKKFFDLPALFAPMEIYLLCADMLDFLSRLEPKELIAAGYRSVNFTLNGIDHCILEYEDYAQAVAEEMIRVSRDMDSVIFVCRGNFVTQFIENTGFRKVEIPGLLSNSYDQQLVYEKSLTDEDIQEINDAIPTK
jgi:hypothetical protein